MRKLDLSISATHLKVDEAMHAALVEMARYKTKSRAQMYVYDELCRLVNKFRIITGSTQVAFSSSDVNDMVFRDEAEQAVNEEFQQWIAAVNKSGG